jgi:hypothetical protein
VAQRKLHEPRELTLDLGIVAWQFARMRCLDMDQRLEQSTGCALGEIMQQAAVSAGGPCRGYFAASS